MEGVMLRTWNLREINLARCKNVNAPCLRDIVWSCHQTLTSLDVSHCKRLNADALSWLGGALGFNTPPCKRLQTLNAENCVGVGDAGLCGLALGCHKLRWLNLAHCTKVTDTGTNGLTKGCTQLTLCNLARCFQITNKTLGYFGRRCHQLRSLHLGNCQYTGDA